MVSLLLSHRTAVDASTGHDRLRLTADDFALPSSVPEETGNYRRIKHETARNMKRISLCA